MNRQLRASGGIMDVTPRENFGLGSSLKKFVRKIIPNEVADIAVKAAPFVAPFNPALAAGMSGLGTFDQTGSIGSGLKAGAMNYGGGQLARYAGGAGFQGNPFGQGGAFTQGGFRGGFSSPFGNQTGIGKMFSEPNAPISEVQSIGTTGDANIAEQIAAQGRAVNAEQTGLFTEGLTGGAETLANEVSYVPNATSALVDASDMALVGDVKQAAAKEFNLFKAVGDFDYKSLGNKTLELGKKFGKAAFYDKDGNIDKAAVMGAIAFAGSYAEALALADDAGVELTEEIYDEAKKEAKQEEYAGYLENFFAGQKDGGRIGYEGGANELIMEKLKEDIMPDTSTEEMIMIMTDDGPKMIKRSDYEAMPGMFRDTTTSLYGDAARGRPVPEFAKGGRIGYARGTPGDTTMFEELNTDTIYRPEPESTITLPEEMPGDDRMAGSQGYDEQYNSFIQLRDQFQYQEGDSYSDANRKAKQIVYGMKDGGRINRRLGSPEKGEGDGLMEMLSVEVDAGGDDEEDMKMAGITFSSAEKSYLFRKLGGAGGSDRSFTMPQLYRVLSNPDRYTEDAAVLKEIAIMGLGKKDGGRIGLKDGTDKSMLEKFLNSKLVQEGRYGLSEFLMNDPILFGTPDKFKDGKNNKRGTFKRDSSEYDKLSPEKQAYIEAFLNSDEDNLFLKPGKISFPINERMREHNKNYDEQQTISEYFPDSKINMKFANYENRAQGGRIGFKNGTGASNRVAQLILERDYLLSKDEDVSYIDLELESLGYKMKAEGGIMEAKVPTGQMRENNAGVAERDYRQTGGFVPVGIKERADDVPAMLSKNEFVMTADAVRGIGNGDVEEGSKKLYNTMKQAEQVGKA